MVMTLQGMTRSSSGENASRHDDVAGVKRSLEGLRRYIRGLCGIDLRSAVWSSDPVNASLCKTLATHASLDVFQFGRGIPLLGVPIDSHLYADGPRASPTRGRQAEGAGSECRREPIAMPSD